MYPKPEGPAVESTEATSTIYWKRIGNAESELQRNKLEYAQYLLTSGNNDARFLATYPDMANWLDEEKAKKAVTPEVK
ncbi:MAG: hypothetical protein P4L74_06475 [Candidatus Doudnabacteria bacterium]|nr:hypothetical protein [Candidatus Doudnabacteria bacterium]